MATRHFKTMTTRNFKDGAAHGMQYRRLWDSIHARHVNGEKVLSMRGLHRSNQVLVRYYRAAGYR